MTKAPDAALLAAARAGDACAAAAALDAGAATQSGDRRGRAPLAIAAAGGHEACVALMLARGAAAGAADCVGDTALHRACTQGNGPIASALIAAGADVNAADEDGWTPLHWAAKCGHEAAVAVALAAGADAAATNNVRRAHIRRLTVCARALTPRRACLLSQDGATALQLACSDAVRAALSPRGARALLAAVRAGDAAATAAALDAGADADGADESADTALHYAVWKGHADVAAVLLARGAEPSRGNAWGSTPLHLAAAQPRSSTGGADAADGCVLRALIAAGADAGARDKARADMLFLRALHASSCARTAPLTRGARAQWGETPLHRAANCGNGDAVTALLAAGADAKAQRHVRATTTHARSILPPLLTPCVRVTRTGRAHAAGCEGVRAGAGGAHGAAARHALNVHTICTAKMGRAEKACHVSRCA
jgi:ankyrin repeat protein